MIKIVNLTKQYDKEVIVDNVTITLTEGHIYGLVGPNGCGKTTLMRCICGFTLPDSGTVEVNGQLIGKDRDFPESVGLILETPSFLPQYSGYKNLMLLANISHGASSQKVAEVMTEIGLDPSSKKAVKKYSLGMRQWLGIAQAIMEDPKILILDEPFNGLDQQGIIDIHSLLQRLKKQGKLIVLASHSAADIAQACDVIFDMNKGQLHLRTPNIQSAEK